MWLWAEQAIWISLSFGYSAQWWLSQHCWCTCSHCDGWKIKPPTTFKKMAQFFFVLQMVILICSPRGACREVHGTRVCQKLLWVGVWAGGWWKPAASKYMQCYGTETEAACSGKARQQECSLKASSNVMSGVCVWIVFSQYWGLFAGGKMNSCPQIRRGLGW